MIKLVFTQHGHPGEGNESVTAHQLAKMLLAGPDYEVVGLNCWGGNTEPEPCMGVYETPKQWEELCVVLAMRPLNDGD
jgi:hypothetical protein